MAHLQLGEKKKKKKEKGKTGERGKDRSGTEAGKVRERTPAGARRGRDAAASCSPRCSAKASPCQPPAPCSQSWLLSVPAPCRAHGMGMAAGWGRADPAAKVGVQCVLCESFQLLLRLPVSHRSWGCGIRAAPTFHQGNAARAYPSPTSHPPAFMEEVLVCHHSKIPSASQCHQLQRLQMLLWGAEG